MKPRTLSTLLLLSAAPTVVAAEIEPRHYVVGQVLRTHTACESLISGGGRSNATCHSSDGGLRLAFGHQFNPTFGIEVGYLDAGRAETTIVGGAIIGSTVHLESSLSAIDAVATAGWNVDDDWRVTVRLGAARYDLHRDSTLTNFSRLVGTSSSHRTDTSLTYGVGVEWRWLTLGYDVISDVGYDRGGTRPARIEDDVDRLHIGVIYRF